MKANDIMAAVESVTGKTYQLMVLVNDTRDSGIQITGQDWPEFCGGIGSQRGDTFEWNASGMSKERVDDRDFSACTIEFHDPRHRIEAAWTIAKISARLDDGRIVWDVTGDSDVETVLSLSYSGALDEIRRIKDTHPCTQLVSLTVPDGN